MVFLPSNARVKQESLTDVLVIPPLPSNVDKMYTADESNLFRRYDSLSFIYTSLNSSALCLWAAFGEIDKSKTSVNRSFHIDNAREFIEQVSATLEFPNKVASIFPPATDIPDCINDTIVKLPLHLQQIASMRAEIDPAVFAALTINACRSIGETVTRLEYPLPIIKLELELIKNNLAKIAAN